VPKNLEKQFQVLFEKFFSGIATPEEERELAGIVKKMDETSLEFALKEHWNISKEIIPVLRRDESGRILKNILSQRPTERKRNLFMTKGWFRAAAAVLLLVSISTIIYRILTNESKEDSLLAEELVLPEQILPGTNRAMLSLADGTTIFLDDAEKGVIAEQSSSKVILNEQEQLVYEKSGQRAHEIVYNTLTAPRGGQYRLQLSDGTVVYLNSASKIRFPVVFEPHERKVEIEGEVYIEVMQKETWPFRVLINGIKVEALGTRFNIMGYQDESLVKTTLLSGSVSVETAGKTSVLRPGQQANVDALGSMTVLSDVETDQVVAWKDGWFRFSGSGIEEIMRQISRWYDLDVEYSGELPEKTYTGVVSRSSDLSQVLQIMESAGIKFSIHGKTIIVGS
jgi:transmembrane sensor